MAGDDTPVAPRPGGSTGPPPPRTALAVVRALAEPLGVAGDASVELTGQVVLLARARDVRLSDLDGSRVSSWEDVERVLAGPEGPARRAAESLCRAVHDVLFSAPGWRGEVGYEHPMDQAG
jgi:hypothetical protein